MHKGLVLYLSLLLLSFLNKWLDVMLLLLVLACQLNYLKLGIFIAKIFLQSFKSTKSISRNDFYSEYIKDVFVGESILLKNYEHGNFPYESFTTQNLPDLKVQCMLK